MMGIIQEKIGAFRAPFVAFVLKLGRKSPQQQQQSSPPSANDDLERSPQFPPQPPLPSPSSSFNAESELLNFLIDQQHQQWQGAILTFCFSFTLEISLRFSKDNQSRELPASLVLLSFAFLLIFCILLVALFIRKNHAGASQVLGKVAVLLTAAAFCYAIAIPFPLNLKLTAWTLFLISLFVVAIVPRHFSSRINNNSL